MIKSRPASPVTEKACNSPLLRALRVPNQKDEDVQDLCKAFIETGTDIMACDEHGSNALHWAVAQDYAQTAYFLIQVLSDRAVNSNFVPFFKIIETFREAAQITSSPHMENYLIAAETITDQNRSERVRTTGYKRAPN